MVLLKPQALISIIQMWTDAEIKALKETLEQTKGYLVFPAEGDELVIIREKDFSALKGKKSESQLNLDVSPVPTEETAWHDIPQNTDTDEDEPLDPYDVTEDEMPIDNIESDANTPLKKVKFEPIRGDLSPDLQE